MADAAPKKSKAKKRGADGAAKVKDPTTLKKQRKEVLKKKVKEIIRGQHAKQKVESAAKQQTNSKSKPHGKSSTPRGKPANGKTFGGGDNKRKFPSKKFAKGGPPAKKPKVLTKEERKEMRKKRKAEKPHADLAANLVSIYGVNLKSMTRKERIAKIGEILEGAEGKIASIAARHDVSRAFQSIFKHGSPEQRKVVFDGIKDQIQLLSTHHFGHHLILKVVQYGDDEMKKAVVETLAPNVRKLALHTETATVLDYLYAASGKIDRGKLREAIYGREFAIFQDGHSGERTFLSIVENHDDKRKSVLKNMREFLDRAINKEMLMFRYTHTVLREYLEHAPLKQAKELVDLVAKYTPSLHNSHDGAVCIMHCIAYGSNKNRKAVIKALKDHVVEVSTHEHGYLAVIRALDLIDDTVLLSKTLIKELTSNLMQLAQDVSGSKVLLHCLNPKSLKYLSPDELKLLGNPLLPNELDEEQLSLHEVNAAIADGKYKEEDLSSTNKKDPSQRRAELLAKLLPPLVLLCTTETDELIRHVNGSNILVEATLEAYSQVHEDGKQFEAEVNAEQLNPLLDAICELVTQDLAPSAPVSKADRKKKNKKKPAADAANPDADAAAAESVHVMESTRGHYALKRLIVNLKPNSHAFCDRLLEQLRKEYSGDIDPALNITGETQLHIWAHTNRGAFVIAAMLEHASQHVKDVIASDLEAVIKSLKSHAKVPGCALVLKLLGYSDAKPAAKPRADKAPAKAAPKKKRGKKEGSAAAKDNSKSAKKGKQSKRK